MTTETSCTECQRLLDDYSEATMRFMRFDMRFNYGSRGVGDEMDREGKRLHGAMKAALHTLNAHQMAQHGELRY